jgi:hypothetical protein
MIAGVTPPSNREGWLHERNARRALRQAHPDRRDRTSLAAALIGAGVALALTPITPAGIPVIAATSAAWWESAGGHRRARRPGLAAAGVAAALRAPLLAVIVAAAVTAALLRAIA